MKTCSQCKQSKPLTEFANDVRAGDGKVSYCRACGRAYYYRNHEAGLRSRREYRKNNRARMAELNRLWRLRYPGRRNATERLRYQKKRADVLAYQKEWIAKNRSRKRAMNRRYVAKKRRSDPTFKLKENLRRRVRHALNGYTKSVRTMELIGCSATELRNHIQSLFQPGMTWDNYGKGFGKWNVDHIVPCARFNLDLEAEQKKCFHFSNLQPLWESDNLAKSDS